MSPLRTRVLLIACVIGLAGCTRMGFDAIGIDGSTDDGPSGDQGMVDGLRWDRESPLPLDMVTPNDIPSIPDALKPQDAPWGHDASVITPTWKVVKSPVPTSLMAVHGTSVKDVWVVGGKGTVLQYNGSSWKVHQIGTLTLNALWCASSKDVWVVGDSGSARRYNGISWLSHSTPATGALWSVGGADPGDVWFGGPFTGVYHYVGAGIVKVPAAGSIRGFHGVSTKQVWAVGDQGVIQRWNGGTWLQLSSSSKVNLQSVWMTSATTGWVVGDSGTVWRYTGSGWKVVSPSTNFQLRGVWASSDKDVWAVGAIGTVLHYNGVTWTQVAASTSADLNGIWGSGPNDIWVVGNNSTILHYSN